MTETALEFTDPHYGTKFSARPMSWPIAKIVSMLPAQLRRKTGDIQIPPEAQDGDYDLIVIGAPTWWLTTCMPVRSYLHDPAAGRILKGKPFAAFSTSRRYYKNNLKTIRHAGEASGGTFIDATHFVADGNQVMSMWSWLAFMRHDEAARPIARRQAAPPQPAARLRAAGSRLHQRRRRSGARSTRRRGTVTSNSIRKGRSHARSRS